MSGCINNFAGRSWLEKPIAPYLIGCAAAYRASIPQAAVPAPRIIKADVYWIALALHIVAAAVDKCLKIWRWRGQIFPLDKLPDFADIAL